LQVSDGYAQVNYHKGHPAALLPNWQKYTENCRQCLISPFKNQANKVILA